METVAQVGRIIQGEMPPGAVNGESATRLARFRNR